MNGCVYRDGGDGGLWLSTVVGWHNWDVHRRRRQCRERASSADSCQRSAVSVADGWSAGVWPNGAGSVDDACHCCLVYWPIVDGDGGSEPRLLCAHRQWTQPGLWFCILTLWLPLLSYGHSYKVSSARPGQAIICDIWTLWHSLECQSAQKSKITNDGLTRSGTGCFIAVPIWQQWASKGCPCSSSICL